MKLKVQYKKTGRTKVVPAALAYLLDKRGLATVVEPTAAAPEPTQEPEPAVEPEPEISPRTGRPKRTYTRRDMRADD